MIMATEVAISFTSLRDQLENEKSSLFKLDENIKKIVQPPGRFTNDRFNQEAEFTRVRVGRSFQDNGNNYKDDHFGKRKQETKTVFSRLSRANDSDGEDDSPSSKRAKVPSAVCRELPTRAAVLRAQGGDEQARTRNRRIFGSLLGTLQKFKQEEIVLQTKEEKRAQVERKIEEQARKQKEKEQKERKTLFAERDNKKATIKALEAKMGRVLEFEKWEQSQKQLQNFIVTKGKPYVYWMPKIMCDKSNEKLTSSKKLHEKLMIRKRFELQVELVRIEQRCLRVRGPGAKENDPSQNDKMDEDEEIIDIEKGNKRNKFAMDADEKDDSDHDDRHDDELKIESDVDSVQIKQEDTKMDTSTETSSRQNEEKPESPVVEAETNAEVIENIDDRTPETLTESEHS